MSKYKVIKLGDGETFAVIRVSGNQTYTISRHKGQDGREAALRALKRLNDGERSAATNESISEAKDDNLERNVRKLHRLGPKKDTDKRKAKRYGRILKRVRAQMENRRVDPAAFKPQYVGKKLSDQERNASKDHFKTMQDPEKAAKLATDRAEAEKRKQEKIQANMKAAGGLASLMGLKNGGKNT